jgi:hypothetical protein
MEDEEIKRQLGALRETYVSLLGEILQLRTRQESAVKILAERLAHLQGVKEEEILEEVKKLGDLLHDDVLLKLERRYPNLAGELDKRDDEDIPTGEDSP